ncbi:MAG: vitamin K epoxide reductase [Candidatus Melainabacteria bacterium]|nr:vitamin K epoxide reductase [Candidatus Melainabacteria bacterium]
MSCISAIVTGIAVYMGLFQWGVISHVWDPAFGHQSEAVLTSHVSHLLYKLTRLPDAILGAIAYFGDIIFAMAGSSRRWMDRPWLVLLFGLYVIPPAAVSIILVIIQGTVLSTWCFLCLITATLSVFLIFLSYAEVFATLLLLHKIWKKTKSKRLLWDTLWGRPSETAYQIAKTIHNH